MLFQALTICALLSLQTLSSLAEPIDPLPDTTELVMTPGGLIPKANIHAVPAGARVHHTQGQVQIISTNGTVLHTVPVSSDKLSISSTVRRTARRDLQSGYIAYASWRNPGSIALNFFSTSWTVPPIPTNSDGQLLYWFNGLVPDSFDAILQPVLQYGESPAGGGNFYAISPWYVLGSDGFHGPLTRVQPGQQLTGVMSLSSAVANGTHVDSTWICSFPSMNSSLVIVTPEIFSWAYEALEIYATPFATDLPAGKTALTGINIRGPSLSSVDWSVDSDDSDRVFMSVTSASSTNGAMQITYPQ